MDVRCSIVRGEKGNFTLFEAMKTQEGSRGLALLFLSPWRYLEMCGQRHAPAALPPGKRSGIHCIGGWKGPRTGLDGCGKYRPHRDSIPDHQALSESL